MIWSMSIENIFDVHEAFKVGKLLSVEALVLYRFTCHSTKTLISYYVCESWLLTLYLIGDFLFNLVNYSHNFLSNVIEKKPFFNICDFSIPAKVEGYKVIHNFIRYCSIYINCILVAFYQNTQLVCCYQVVFISILWWGGSHKYIVMML